MRILLTIVSLLYAFAVAADDSWQYILSKHGYDPNSVNDLTKSKIIKLSEPKCAYVNITGIEKMPTEKTQDLQAWLEFYDGNGNYLKKRVVLNAQGNSSMDFPKKNISFEFYEETWGAGKTTDITFGNWVKQDGFHLKAFYTDYFRGCCKIAYDMYDDITSDRENPLPWQRAGITSASNNARCHPNGFPCYVYLNDNFYGVFVWSLKKNYKNMGMEKDNPKHIHIDGILADNTIFRDIIDWSQFEVRNPKNLYCIEVDTIQPEGILTYKKYNGDNPTELIDESMPYYDPNNQDHVLTNEVKQSLINLSKYYTELKNLDASNPDPDTFKRIYSQYFDIQGLTDYIVHSLVTNNYDGHWKNWQWFTYDGIKWYVEPYDLDATFGHHASGLLIFHPEWNQCCLGTRYYEFPVNAGIQRLFMKYFYNEIAEHYSLLRNELLIDTLRYLSYFKTWTDRIGTFGYELEYTKWKNSPCINETIASPNWETEDNWENYNIIPSYSPDSTYHVGDKCKTMFRVWTATATTRGVQPYQQMGCIDSIERVEEWISGRISLLDEYFSYDPDNIKYTPSDKHLVGARKVIRDKHLYIIRDNETYSIDGKRIMK